MTDNNHRLAILVTGVFFVIGLAVLALIDVERGRAAAQAP
jgi:UMF1 family MFS transporter